MTEFAFLQERLARQSKRKRVVLACPHDSHTEYVITRALDEGWAEFCLTTYLPLTKTFEQVVERTRQQIVQQHPQYKERSVRLYAGEIVLTALGSRFLRVCKW